MNLGRLQSDWLQSDWVTTDDGLKGSEDFGTQPGGFRSQGIPQIIRTLNHDLVLNPMVTWGSSILSPGMTNFIGKMRKNQSNWG